MGQSIGDFSRIVFLNVEDDMLKELLDQMFMGSDKYSVKTIDINDNFDIMDVLNQINEVETQQELEETEEYNQLETETDDDQPNITWKVNKGKYDPRT